MGNIKRSADLIKAPGLAVLRQFVFDLDLRLTAMDANLKKILDELPDKPPRSRLEPYSEFIEELRRRGRTYRDVADILAEKCAVQVTGSGVHDYLRTRSRAKASLAEVSPSKATQSPVSTPVAGDSLAAASSGEQVQRKIAALKARNPSMEPSLPGFEYNPDEPLVLKRK